MDRQSISLTTTLDSARAQHDAAAIVSAGHCRIAVDATGRRVCAEAVARTAVSPEDDIALQIMGWRRGDDGRYRRDWHVDTESSSIAEDISRALEYGFRDSSSQCYLERRNLAATATR